jgi:hypothetical protein
LLSREGSRIWVVAWKKDEHKQKMGGLEKIGELSISDQMLA